MCETRSPKDSAIRTLNAVEVHLGYDLDALGTVPMAALTLPLAVKLYGAVEAMKQASGAIYELAKELELGPDWRNNWRRKAGAVRVDGLFMPVEPFMTSEKASTDDV